MKRLLLAPLLLGFISPVMAKEICTLTSEVEPDVTISLKYTGSAGNGTSLSPDELSMAAQFFLYI